RRSGGSCRADLGRLAGTRPGGALGGGRREGVGRTVVRGPVAGLGDVTVPRCSAADGRALRIRGAGGAAPGAELGHVADAGRGAAFGRARLEGVRRAGGAGPGTELGDVAGAGGRATLRGARLDHVGRAVVGGAVAAL